MLIRESCLAVCGKTKSRACVQCCTVLNAHCPISEFDHTNRNEATRSQAKLPSIPCNDRQQQMLPCPLQLSKSHMEAAGWARTPKSEWPCLAESLLLLFYSPARGAQDARNQQGATALQQPGDGPFFRDSGGFTNHYTAAAASVIGEY